MNAADRLNEIEARANAAMPGPWAIGTDEPNLMALVAALRAVLDLTQDLGDEVNGPTCVPCYEVRHAIDSALGGA